MKRLTKSYEDHISCIPQELRGDRKGYSMDSEVIIEKLGAYEDLEEKGMIAILPCKVGDKIYFADRFRGIVKDLIVNKIIIDADGMFVMAFTRDFRSDDFGKIVFLDKTMAKEALKKMKREG